MHRHCVYKQHVHEDEAFGHQIALVRDAHRDNVLRSCYVPNGEIIADIIIKHVPNPRFQRMHYIEDQRSMMRGVEGLMQAGATHILG